MMLSAQASSEHAHHFANLAQIASDDLYTTLLGSRANRVLEGTFQESNNENSYDLTHFLYDGQDVIGMVNGFTRQEKQTIGHRTSSLTMKYAGWRFLQYMALGIYLSEIIDFIGNNLEAGDYYIQMVAIYPQYRGQGHSKKLLAYAQNLAQKNKCQRLVLDVHNENTIAINAYQRVGFTIIDESKTIHVDGKPLSMFRMAKPLETHFI